METDTFLDTSCVLGMPYTYSHWISTQPCKVDMIVLICYVRRLMLTEIKQIASSHSAGKQGGKRRFKLSPVAGCPCSHQLYTGAPGETTTAISDPHTLPAFLPHRHGPLPLSHLQVLPPCFSDPYRADPGFLPSQQGTTFYVTAL